MNQSIYSKFFIPFSFFCCIPSHAQPLLNEVVVTASRVETPLRELGVSISVITKDELELQGYQTVADALRTQVGVSVSNSGGQGKNTAVRIRGEEGYRTLVVVDGIDVSDPSGPQVGPHIAHLMTSGDIERVEVLRGPQGFIYGADAGGVINILTQSAQQGLNGEVSLETGRYQSRKASAFIGGANEFGGAFVSVTDNQLDGFDLSESKAINPIEEDGYQNTTLHSKFFVNISESLKAQLVIRDTTAKNEYDGYFSDDALGKFDQTSTRLSLVSQYDSIEHQLAFQYNETERERFGSGLFIDDSVGSTKKLEYLGGISKDDKVLSAVWGADFQGEELISNGKRYKRDQFAFFSELRAAYDNTFFGSVGVRYDDSDEFGDHLSVRLSGAYLSEVAEGVSLRYRSSLGSGFRAPSPYEMSTNANSPISGLLPLIEESSSGVDVGVDLLINQNFTAQLTYFNQVIEDAITYEYLAEFDSGYYAQSLGVGHSKGVEVSFDWSVIESVGLFANYTYNETLTPEDTQRLRRPKQFGNFGARFSFWGGKFKSLLSSRYVKDSIDFGGIPLDDYNVIDLSVTYKLEDNVTLFARIENAADKKYQEVSGYDAAEAAFYFGLKTRF